MAWKCSCDELSGCLNQRHTYAATLTSECIRKDVSMTLLGSQVSPSLSLSVAEEMCHPSSYGSTFEVFGRVKVSRGALGLRPPAGRSRGCLVYSGPSVSNTDKCSKTSLQL